MNYPENRQTLRFNMQGYLMEFDKRTHAWTWNRWEYAHTSDGKRRVVRRKGGLEFMKMLPNLLNNNNGTTTFPTVRSQKDLETVLKKHGVEYVFLYQGDACEEKDFEAVEEAERFYGLENCPSWDLTEYWFSFDWGMQSWGMYDAFTGQLKFTPATAEERLKQQKAAAQAFAERDSFDSQPANGLWN